MCRAIEEAGVDRISLPDTVGIMRPVGMYNFVILLKKLERQ
jgi:2-isopropylmalate synthase